MEIIRSLRLESDHAIVMYRGSARNSKSLDFESLERSTVHEKSKSKRVQPESNKHSGELSASAYRRLKRAVSWLELISETKEADVAWKCSFLTLTVPNFSQSLHEEKLKGCLNVLLQYLRVGQGVLSYVWKAELTRKGKLHYHLLTDRPLNETKIRARWNKILSEKQILISYQDKFSKMNLKEYLDHREKNEGIANAVEYKNRCGAYAYGKSTNWSNPKSVQVDKIPASDSLVTYLGKYLGKSTKKSDDSPSIKGRIWGCSQNLSEKNACKFVIDPMTPDVEIIHDLLAVADACESIEFEKDGLRKEIGYKISFKSEYWHTENNGRRLNQIMNAYVRSMRNGDLRHNHQVRIAKILKKQLQENPVRSDQENKSFKLKSGKQLLMRF